MYKKDGLLWVPEHSHQGAVGNWLQTTGTLLCLTRPYNHGFIIMNQEGLSDVNSSFSEQWKHCLQITIICLFQLQAMSQ